MKALSLYFDKITGIKKAFCYLLGAVMLAIPFSFGKFWCLSWFSLSLLVFDIFCQKKTFKRVFCSLFCFFYLFYVFVYSWFVSLYPLDFVGLGNFESLLVIAGGVLLIPLIHGLVMTLCTSLGYAVSRNFKGECVWAFAFSCAFTIGEYLQSKGTLAFPWAMLGISQTERLEVLQSASLFGSYFVTFLIVFVNCLLAAALLKLKETEKRKAAAYFAAALCVFGLNFVYGKVVLSKPDNGQEINALVLQGNIASSEKWKDNANPKEVYTKLAKTAKVSLDRQGKSADFTVLPETAFPVTLVQDGKNPYYSLDENETLKNISKIFNTKLFAGAFYEKGDKTYNSVYVFFPDGTISEPYNKRCRVPFGEFLPYREVLVKLLPFLSDINMLDEDLAKGESLVPLDVGFAKAGVLICFDSVFAENARMQVKNGAEIIALSTNDSWYKTSVALDQHASHARLRAIENGVYVVRSANTGISMIIDKCGRVVEKTNVNECSFIFSSVTLLQNKTLYTHIGNACILVFFVYLAALLVIRVIKKSRTKAG